MKANNIIFLDLSGDDDESNAKNSQQGEEV